MSFDTKNLFDIRAISTALIFASVCEFVIGGYVFSSVTNKHPGGWWGVIIPIIAGVIGFGANTRTYITVTLVVTACGFITALAAVIIDGQSTGTVDMSQGCTNTETGQVWGSPQVTKSTLRPACMTAGIAAKEFTCVCADDEGFCWNYELAHGDNCGYIIRGYYGLLATSTALLTVVAALSLALIYQTSMSLYFPTISNGDEKSEVKEVALKDGAEYTAAGVEEQ